MVMRLAVMFDASVTTMQEVAPTDLILFGRFLVAVPSWSEFQWGRGDDAAEDAEQHAQQPGRLQASMGPRR
jgi:hypothetical protein